MGYIMSLHHSHPLSPSLAHPLILSLPPCHTLSLSLSSLKEKYHATSIAHGSNSNSCSSSKDSLIPAGGGSEAEAGSQGQGLGSAVAVGGQGEDHGTILIGGYSPGSVSADW
jgi:hypothetical protein